MRERRVEALSVIISSSEETEVFSNDGHCEQYGIKKERKKRKKRMKERKKKKKKMQKKNVEEEESAEAVS